MKKILLLLSISISACTAIGTTQSSGLSPASVTPAQTLSAVVPPTNTPSPTIPSHISGLTAPPFPRLGMLWPNPYNQPLDQIARYDWVILDDWMKDFIDPLHALNPDLQLLASTNACEVSFRPDDPSYNAYLQTIPYQWYLTQVGTTLRTEVDATQTMLPVQDVVIQGKDGKLELFVPGDTALLEGESVYIERVDADNRILFVKRGYIRPASAHPAGTRLAAHITFWPNSWVLNISTLSPAGVADPAIGPERWAEYNARIGAQILADPRWIGIFVDRSDPNQSWLVGNSTARSIDPDQSNRLPTTYSDFDDAWNQGLSAYLEHLRELIGPNRVLLLNWGITQYAVVNGSNFEGIPDDSWADSWHSQIFGPVETGSYSDWMNQARQPNLTMIETYEDNSRTAPTATDDYFNRCNEVTFTPNYQKMRFGLTSALLNDGYFSYEMNTQGHGALCLMWFDEYDNAGKERGYLGYPIGPAQRLADLVLPDQIPTKQLDTGEELTAWRAWADAGYRFSAQIDTDNPAKGTGSARFDIAETQGEYWRTAFSLGSIPVQKDKAYTLSFYARADRPRTINAWVQRDSQPWDTWLDFGELHLTTAWQKYEITLDSLGDDAQARLTFGLGATEGSVWLDAPHFYQGNADIWRRDFENGIVLVNASNETVTVPLEAIYRKINGKQDRSINDGSFVRQVTVSPQDGIILLKNK